MLEASDVKIVHVPDHIVSAVKKYCHFQLGQITSKRGGGGVQGGSEELLTLQWENKMVTLLRYWAGLWAWGRGSGRGGGLR